jgi:dienelactone hydrolase
MLGKTIFGMQVLDIIKAIDYLESRDDIDMNNLACYGWGKGGILVMYAAALDNRVKKTVSMNGLISYKQLVLNKVYNIGVDMFIPKVLKHYDLADVASLIAPRPLTLINAIDHMRKKVSKNTVEKEYEMTSKVYELLGNPKSFSIKSFSSIKSVTNLFS